MQRGIQSLLHADRVRVCALPPLSLVANEGVRALLTFPIPPQRIPQPGNYKQRSPIHMGLWAIFWGRIRREHPRSWPRERESAVEGNDRPLTGSTFHERNNIHPFLSSRG